MIPLGQHPGDLAFLNVDFGALDDHPLVAALDARLEDLQREPEDAGDIAGALRSTDGLSDGLAVARRNQLARDGRSWVRIVPAEESHQPLVGRIPFQCSDHLQRGDHRDAVTSHDGPGSWLGQSRLCREIRELPPSLDQFQPDKTAIEADVHLLMIAKLGGWGTAWRRSPHERIERAI